VAPSGSGVPIRGSMSGMRALTSFLRANPQAAVLLAICLVLGLGTFIAVLIALGTAGNGTPSGEPSGVIGVAGAWMP
jgi:hypothetical protein